MKVPVTVLEDLIFFAFPYMSAIPVSLGFLSWLKFFTYYRAFPELEYSSHVYIQSAKKQYIMIDKKKKIP